MGDKDGILSKFYIINGETMQEVGSATLSALSINEEPEEIYHGGISDFECSFKVDVSKEEHEKFIAMFKFTRNEINNMFDAVEHGGIVLFDCEWSYEDNENVKYRGVACDMPSTLRKFLKETHHMRMEYKIIYNNYKRKE